MLAQLARYAEREGLVTEPGFAPKAVRWAILIGEDGLLTGGLLRLGDDEKERQGRRFSRAPHLSLGEMKRGGTGTRHFLADALEVVIRLGAEDDPKVAAKHAFFLGQLERAESVVPELAAAARQLADPEVQARLREAALEQKAKPTENASFAVRRHGRWAYSLEDADWHDWWRAYRATLQPPPKKEHGKAAPPARMRCMMTGELVAPAPTQPKIKGLASVGGHSAGDVLAAFKQDSFRSYGLVQAENAPVSAEAATRYTTALNRLIRRGTRFQHAIVAHWYEPRPELGFDPELDLDVVAMLQGGFDDEDEQLEKERKARELLSAIRRGDAQARAKGDTPFHAYTLSGAAGRVMVRDVIDGPFRELLAAHEAWFDDLAICRRDDATRLARAPKFYAVLAATVRELKDVPAPLETALWRSALRHTAPIPRDALARALARARIDVIQGNAPRHARYGLIKAVINRSIRLGTDQGGTHPVKPGLDEDHPDSAYHCGRLMAVLAALQYSALGDVGAGVVQRYYAAASASPALVLGRLLRNAQFHLNSSKVTGGLRFWYEGKIGAILGHVEGRFPTTLGLEKQSLFALGYYQQQAHDRTKKTPAGEAIERAETDSLSEQE